MNADVFDNWLLKRDCSGLVCNEPLMPMEGAGHVLFPPTYAAGQTDGFPGGYTINRFEKEGKPSVCLIDSVGSQANRLEPVFLEPPYCELVPAVTVKAGEVIKSILEMPHRAGDACVRCSVLHQELHDAFLQTLLGNFTPMAKLAPTSLALGAWDARDTQAKLPRLVGSTIRAYDIRELTRRAQYTTSMSYIDLGLLEKPDDDDKPTKEAYADRGFSQVPAPGYPGGILADGGVERSTTLSLSALRRIHAKGGAMETLKLRRYLLGLSMVVFTLPQDGYLRQGCSLVRDVSKPYEYVEAYGDGRRPELKLTHEEALAYAKMAAKAFGVGPDRHVDFSKTMAEEDIAKAKAKKNGKKGKKDKADADGNGAEEGGETTKKSKKGKAK